MSDRSEDCLTRKVREFYERFQFPGVRPLDRDGMILMRRLARTPAGRLREREGMRRWVLDAGCGTGNTAISLARRFPDTDFLAVDVSGPSLAAAEEEAARAGLGNIRFRKWDLMELIPVEDQFDVVLCLGVLHHVADMKRVLTNLGRCLAQDGDLYLWVYGRHGRYRHGLNRRLLQLLLDARPGGADPVRLAREFASRVQAGAPIRDLFGDAPGSSLLAGVVAEEAWIADQFLHPKEAAVDMEELLALVQSAGLCLDTWLGAPADLSRHLGSRELLERFDRLGPRERLIALDLLLKPEHYFVSVRKE